MQVNPSILYRTLFDLREEYLNSPRLYIYLVSAMSASISLVGTEDKFYKTFHIHVGKISKKNQSCRRGAGWTMAWRFRH